MPGNPWKITEIKQLIHQVVIEKKKLPDIRIPGRSYNAINGQLVVLRKSRQITDRPTRKMRRWSSEAIEKLKATVSDRGLSGKKITELGLLGSSNANRSKDSVSQKMRRLGLGNSEARAKAKASKRLTRERSRALNAYILGPGRNQLTSEIARIWCMRDSTIRSRRWKLKASLSWHAARKMVPRRIAFASAAVERRFFR